MTDVSYIYFALIEEFSTCTPLLLLSIVLYFFCVKFFKLLSTPEPPELTYVKSCDQNVVDDSNAIKKKYIEDLIERCPLLKETYSPPWLWGRSGHIQTAIYGALGHRGLIRTADVRHRVLLPDGTTVTFDVFNPLKSHSAGDFTLALCPGLANSSESVYIRTCVHHAQEAGYRCAVLNHLGALKDERLTSSRVFKYGDTEEYTAMITKLLTLYPTTRFVAVGFSMGGNIVTKYLGEKPDAIDRIVIGMSICQGYDAARTVSFLQNWEGGRRFYEFIMIENFKRLLRNHVDQVVTPYVKEGVIDEQLLWSATSFLALDEYYSRRIAGFEELNSYYDWCSCIKVLDKIQVPMIFVNALDDPIMPLMLLEPIKKLAETTPNFLLALTKHGGHLGFLEGSSLAPNSVTWLDRFIVQMSNAAVDTYGM